jgi:hypothetical protein
MDNTSDAMTWFVITTVAFLVLMAVGTFVAVHSYDKKRSRRPHDHR